MGSASMTKEVLRLDRSMTFDRPYGVIRLVRFFIGPALCKLGGGNMQSICVSTVTSVRLLSALLN